MTKRILFYISLTGLLLTWVVNLLSVIGIDVEEKISFYWVIFFLLFIVWPPIIFYLKKEKEMQEDEDAKEVNLLEDFPIAFKGTPAWVIMIVGLTFFYSLLALISSNASEHGTVAIRDGQYILHSHGTLLRKLTEQEYHHIKTDDLRIFSGICLLFYSVATATLYKFSGLKYH